MANCSDCIKINPIAACAELWEVGGVDTSLNGETLLYELKNANTGRIYQGETSPVASGIVEIDLADTDLTELMNHVYLLTLYLDGPDPIEITIGDQTGCCVEITTKPTVAELPVTFSVEACAV